MRVAVAAILLTLALGTPALAGGWAVTTLDELPPAFHAGQTYDIGYTIRQHGVTPIDVSQVFGGGTTEIKILGPDGKASFAYKGAPSGPVGHYVAKVTFPSEGTWTWQVTQGAFQPQPLGTVTVLPAAGAALAQPLAPAQVPAPAPGPNAFLVAALLLAMSGAAVLFGTRLAVFADRRIRA